jgi:hypothetical protein
MFYESQTANLMADAHSAVAKRTLEMTPRKPHQAREKRARARHSEVEETDDDAVNQNDAQPSRGHQPGEGVTQGEDMEGVDRGKTRNAPEKIGSAKRPETRQSDQSDEEEPLPRKPDSFKRPKRPFENTPQKPQQAKGKRTRSNIYDMSDENSEGGSDSSLTPGRHVLPACGSQSQHIGEATSGLQPERAPIRVHGNKFSEDKAASPQIPESPMDSQEERQAGRRRGRGAVEMEAPDVRDRNRNVFVAGRRRNRRSRTRSLSRDSAARTSANPSREDHPYDVEDPDRGRAGSRHTTPTYSLDARKSPSQSTKGGDPDVPLPSVEKDNDEEGDSDSSSDLQDTLARGIREATEAFFSQRPEIQEEAIVPQNPNKSAEIEARLTNAREDGLWDLVLEASFAGLVAGISIRTFPICRLNPIKPVCHGGETEIC